jgi:ribosomal protein S18 acetylase RimI-like enzyme
MRVVTAQPAEHVTALSMLFRHLPPEDSLARMRGGQRLLEEQGSRLLVAREGGAIVGATLAQVLPGATGVLWPPCAAPGAGEPQRIEDALLHEALAWLRRGGAKLAQAVLAREDTHLGVALVRGGFSRPTELVYFEFSPGNLPDKSCGDGFENYTKAGAATFHDTLMRSHEGTLDFPELDGRRSLREILQGYQAPGHDPARWWLRRDGRTPTGVLILTAMPGQEWELSYVGVVPTARRRGHGRALVLKAIAEARSAGAGVLTVSVDARNLPALVLYRTLGFTEIDRRDVYLKVEC